MTTKQRAYFYAYRVQGTELGGYGHLLSDADPCRPEFLERVRGLIAGEHVPPVDASRVFLTSLSVLAEREEVPA